MRCCKLFYDAMMRLDDSNSIGNVEGIKVLGEANVSLLLSIWSDESVDGLNLDVIEALNGKLDLLLVGQDITDERQCVDVLDLLHRGLSGQWRNNYAVLVHLVHVGNRSARDQWGLLGLAGLRQEEVDVMSHLLNSHRLALLQGFSGRRRLSDLSCLCLSSLRNLSGLRHVIQPTLA
jgi:hypothetical protein